MAEQEHSPNQNHEQRRRRGSRLLPKLASLAIRYADFLVVTSCIAGLIALLLLPALAKNTYVSENALIPGSASPKFSFQDAINAAQLARELRVLSRNSTDGQLAVQSLLVRHLVALGADFYLHPFYPPEPPFSSVHFYSSHQSIIKDVKTCDIASSGRLGMNIAGILRAPRGEGNEAIVLVTPFDAENLTDADATSLGLGLALFHLLSNAAWLAKDIVWLAADSHYGHYSAVAAWLKDYHEPASLHGQECRDPILISKLYHQLIDNKAASVLLEEVTMGDFKRAGVIAAGIVFNVQEGQGPMPSDSLTVSAEGPNGQMPNLDLINVVNNLAIYREGLHMQLDTAISMLEWTWLHFVGQVMEKMGQIAAMFNAGWKFGLPVSEYVQGAATLTRSMFLQALGVPTGAHGAFRDYQLDAVTIVMSLSSEAQGGQTGSLLKFGRLLEGAVRSVNNLLEKFHQSFFLYFLTGPNKFVSVGVYVVPLLLLIITLPLKAAALCTHSNDAGLQGLKTVSSNEPDQDGFDQATTEVSDQGEVGEKVASNVSNQEEHVGDEVTSYVSRMGNKPMSDVSDQGGGVVDKVTSCGAAQGVDLISVSDVNLSVSGCASSLTRWFFAVMTVCLIELWAFLVAVFPPLAYHAGKSSESKAVFWISFSLISLSLLLVLLSRMARLLRVPQDSASSTGVGSNWAAIKASTLGAATIGIGIMSSINFAVALAGAVLLVPMCLSVYPLQHLQKEKGMRPLFAAIIGLAFTLMSSPPVLLMFALMVVSTSPKLSMSKLWDWVECMWCWGSATYLYLSLVHLPCSILCIFLSVSRYD